MGDTQSALTLARSAAVMVPPERARLGGDCRRDFAAVKRVASLALQNVKGVGQIGVAKHAIGGGRFAGRPDRF